MPKKKILIFEKDRSILELIKLVLVDSGYAVAHHDNEDTFFESISVFMPDAILLDIIAPTPIGTRLCEEIKMHPEYSSIPVIVLSTHPNIDMTKNICADEVVKKPFDIDRLLNAVGQQVA